MYDASSSTNGPQWCALKTGLYDDVYRAIDFIYEGNQITCGDKLESVTGKLQFDISSQYDKQQEHLLFTPLFKADNARCFDLEVESSTGVAQYADRLFLSATTDGINYGREQMIEQNEPFVYDKRVLWKKVGRIRKNIGFKLRVITKSPVTLVWLPDKDRVMADSNLNTPVIVQATRLDTSILPRNIFSQSYLLYVINQGADVGAIAGKANQAGQGAYDAQVKNDEQDVELADHDARITANTKAINLLEVRLTTAEGKIVVLRSDVDYLLDEVIDIQAHLVTVDQRLDDVENDVSGIKSDYVSKTVTESQSLASPLDVKKHHIQLMEFRLLEQEIPDGRQPQVRHFLAHSTLTSHTRSALRTHNPKSQPSLQVCSRRGSVFWRLKRHLDYMG